MRHAPCSLVIRDALLVPVEAGLPEVVPGWLAVGADGRIAGLGPGDVPPGIEADEVVDAGGAFVAPGFVSAHSHLFTSGLRGIGADQPLYGWGRAMARYLGRLDTEDAYWLTLHGALDVLANGVTTAYDFTNSRQPFFVDEDGQAVRDAELRPSDYLEAQLEAKLVAGIRFVNSIHLDDHVGEPAAVLDRLDAFVDFARRRAGGGDQLLGLALSGAVQWSDTPATAAIEVAAMHRHDLLNQAHFLETPEQLDLQRAKFAWYDEAGALGPTMLFGHFVHPTPDIVATAAAAGCSMVWQPAANGRLASGVADVEGHLRAGLGVGMGLDDQACTDIADPFQNMRVGLFSQRAATTRADAMSAAQVLWLHTMGSASVLGLGGEVGSLAVGKRADLLVVDPRDPDTGPLWHPLATYVLACGLRNLKRVYVGGRLVSVEGRSANPVAAETSRQVHTRLERLR